MFLVDTDVLSALRQHERSRSIVRWVASQRTGDLYLSVVSIGEIERGIEKQRRRNPDFADTLGGWLDDVIRLYGDRILPVDLPTARRWGRLSQTLGRQDADLLIAASALERGLTVVSRNVRHFEATGVAVLDPSAPAGAG